jgi:hypothetical protein
MPIRTKALVIATAGAAVVGVAIYANLQIHAGTAERSASLPGDELISNSVGVVNHAITIHRPPHDVWQWLAQMGSGRADGTPTISSTWQSSEQQAHVARIPKCSGRNRISCSAWSQGCFRGCAL